MIDFEEIRKQAQALLQKEVQAKIDVLRHQYYNRFHIVQILLQSTLGEFVSIDPILNKYRPEFLECIQKYFNKCIEQVGLSTEEKNLLKLFVSSLNCEHNYIDLMIKQAETFNFDEKYIGHIFKYYLQHFKCDLYIKFI